MVTVNMAKDHGGFKENRKATYDAGDGRKTARCNLSAREVEHSSHPEMESAPEHRVHPLLEVQVYCPIRFHGWKLWGTEREVDHESIQQLRILPQHELRYSKPNPGHDASHNI